MSQCALDRKANRTWKQGVTRCDESFSRRLKSNVGTLYHAIISDTRHPIGEDGGMPIHG